MVYVSDPGASGRLAARTLGSRRFGEGGSLTSTPVELTPVDDHRHVVLVLVVLDELRIQLVGQWLGDNTIDHWRRSYSPSANKQGMKLKHRDATAHRAHRDRHSQADPRSEEHNSE